MNRRMRRELYCIIAILIGALTPGMGGLLIAGYLSTKGWPDGFCVPFGVVSLAASIISGFLIFGFVSDSESVKEWINTPKKEKPKAQPKRLPRYGAWQDESDEYSDRRREEWR